jgi:acyl-CoA thioesterase-2
VARISLDSLLAAIDVVEHAPGWWTAPHLELDYPRIFGGQLLAQAVAVAAASGEGKHVKSLSCLFPREGSTDQPLELRVERPHDGRTFATRRISAHQDNTTFFLADVSLHAVEKGLHHQTMMAEVPSPDRGGPETAIAADLSMIPWETRIVDGTDLADPTPGPASFAFWSRVSDRSLADSLSLHQALLAHATDLTAIGTALRPHAGYSQADAGTHLHTAVTSHSVWFHQPFRLDDWCLVTQQSPITTAGRGFALGHVFDHSGRLVASFAQESMIRVVERS